MESALQEQKAQSNQTGEAYRPKTLAEKLPDIFTYHSPKGDQPKQYQAICEGALDLANIIVNNTPVCADQTAAIRLLREAVMTANASIALDGLV